MAHTKPGRKRLDVSVCRVCLHASATVPLFDGCGTDEQFRYCTMLAADASDGLPGGLCAACADDMQIAYDFRFQAKYAEEYFRITFLPETTPTMLVKDESIKSADEEFLTENDDDDDDGQVLEEQVLEIDKLVTHDDNDEGGGGDAENDASDINHFDYSGESDDGVSDHFAEAFSIRVVDKLLSCQKEEAEEEEVQLQIDIVDYAYEIRTSPLPPEKFEDLNQSSTSTAAADSAAAADDAANQSKTISAVALKILETSREENKKITTKEKQRKNAKIECNLCGGMFTHINSLRQHLMKHSGERPHACEFCDKTFTRNTILQTHRRLHTGVRPYGCDECVSTFVTRDAMKRHKQRDHKDEEAEQSTSSSAKPIPRKSVRRTASTRTVQNLSDQERLLLASKTTTTTTTEPTFVCTICNKSHASRYSLQRHMRTHSETEQQRSKNISPSSPVQTRSAQKSPQSSPSDAKRSGGGRAYKRGTIEKPRRAHRMLDENGKLLHTVKYCKVCQQAFPSKWALARHQEAHNLTQLYECDVCHRAFEEFYNLLYHLGSHENAEELVRKCMQAKSMEEVKVASENNNDDEDDDLPLAQRLHRVSLNKVRQRKCTKPYEKRVAKHDRRHRCLVCKKDYTSSFSLKVHLRKHSGERPFECDQCGKRFTRNNILNVHRRQHTGERPHKCPFCPEALISKQSLMRHVRNFHDKGGGINFPHNCEICYKIFPSIELLVEHEQREHATEAPNSTAADTAARKCKLCAVEFTTWMEYMNHVDAHDVPKRFQCGICEMRFERKFSLFLHLEKHNGNKAACRLCGEKMTRDDLTKHFKSEHFDKRFLDTRCTECSETFYDICDLKRHLNEMHAFKDFNCDNCDIGFATFEDFEKHFNVQHDKVDKVCCECGEFFDSRKNLERHVWKHYV